MNTATNTKHTPEPWSALALTYPAVSHDGDLRDISGADMRRAAVCVNACKGIIDPAAALDGVRKLLKAWLRDMECPEDREEINATLRALGS